MSTGTLAVWIILSALFGFLYWFLPRFDPGPEPLTPEKRQRLSIVMFAMWVGMSLLLTLEANGWDPSRLELYLWVGGAMALVYGLLWFKRHWDSRL